MDANGNPDAAPSTSPPIATADAAAATPVPAIASDPAAPSWRTDEERRAFYAASNARRKARELAKHEARQLAQQGAKSDKAKRDAMEAIEWCRCNLQLEESARALRDGGALKEQRSSILLQFSGTKYKGEQRFSLHQCPHVRPAGYNCCRCRPLTLATALAGSATGMQIQNRSQVATIEGMLLHGQLRS